MPIKSSYSADLWMSYLITKSTKFLCDRQLVRLTHLVIEFRTLNYRTLIKLDIARLCDVKNAISEYDKRSVLSN